MFFAYQGALASSRTRDLAAPIVNLNTVPGSRRPSSASSSPCCRCRAIGGWPPASCWRFWSRPTARGGRCPTSAAIARVRVPDSHDRSSRRRARPIVSGCATSATRAAAARTEVPRSVSLLTSAQLAAIKPTLDRPGPRRSVRRLLLQWGALYLIAFHAVLAAWRWRGLRGDRVLLAAAHVLTAVGFAAMISRPDPLRDLAAVRPLRRGRHRGLVGRRRGVVLQPSDRQPAESQLSAARSARSCCRSCCSSPVSDRARAGSNAKVNLGPFQPIEAIRILLALFLAGYFARHWELLRAVRSDGIGDFRLPSWVNVPRARYALPVVVGVGAALALFFLQKDLGPALMLAVVFLAVYGVARGTAGLMLGRRGAAGRRLLHRIPDGDLDDARRSRAHVAVAVGQRRARRRPDRAGALVDVDRRALRHRASASATRATCRPATPTSCWQRSGRSSASRGCWPSGSCTLAMIARALATARRASTDYAFFLATVLALFLAVPVLLMASGTLGVVPLTGVVTPFLSFGGSAMLANFAALGLLAAIRSDTRSAGGSAGVPHADALARRRARRCRRRSC